MKLYIGNKNYSSWSMRPWLLMTEAGIAFDEVRLRLADMGPASDFKRTLSTVTPAGRVPTLVFEEGSDKGLVVWDSLAIAEALAERHPDKALWPRDPRQRARARSLCAEMHSGFAALRRLCPMNIEASLPHIGPALLEREPALVADLARLDAMWSDALAESGGPMLFGSFGIVDAFYAPVASRMLTYGLPLSPAASGYVQRIAALDGYRAWVREALGEHDWVAVDEPYRDEPGSTSHATRLP